MSVWDIINGSFESVGGVLCWLNVRRLLKDREVKGVSWSVQFFFGAWGWWNCFYYPALHQWFSFWGGIFLAGGNTVWIILSAYYIRKKA